MTQNDLEKTKLDPKGIPGPRVVAWLFGGMFGFLAACWLVLQFARQLGQKEGVRENYSAVRDPVAWLFILLILVACGVLAWWTGKNAKNRS